jgi:hypothetical protein
VTPQGAVTRLPRDGQAGAVSVISATFIGFTGTLLATAVRDGDGNLRVIDCRVDADGNIARGKEGQAGAATRISAFGLITPRIVTAVRDGAGNLKVISWGVAPTTNKVERLDDESAGAVSLISGSLCGFDFAPPNVIPFQTSVRNGSGNLKIITWRSTLQGTAITRFPGGEASAGAVSLISTACFR